jgi:hypothetical protein
LRVSIEKRAGPWREREVGREEKRVSMQIVHKPRALLVREREKY